MEARDVKVYLEYQNQDKEFYNFYQCESEKIDMGEFLDNVYEETVNFNKIYGIKDGQRYKEYTVLLTFNNSRNNKNYMVFTDENKDIEGKIILYGLVYDEDNQEAFMGYIKDLNELNDILDVMKSIYITKH